jgi:hypothetical protein
MFPDQTYGLVVPILKRQMIQTLIGHAMGGSLARYMHVWELRSVAGPAGNGLRLQFCGSLWVHH